MIKYTTEEFVNKAKLIHGDKYDYSMVNYKGATKKVSIIYNNIIYQQTPSCHLSGFCPENKVIKMNTELFILNSIKIHGNKYDYSLVEYKNRYDKVKIIYNNIIYYQTPDMHLRGFKPEMIVKNKTTLDFIKKSKKTYGEKYDYSLTEYVNKLTKVKIIYSGVTYEQLPRYHFKTPPELSNKSEGENKIKKYLINKNINFLTQKVFDNCKYKIKLRYDFYLPKYNTLIEFDGIQHFKSIDFFGGFEEYKNTKLKDKLKNKYAKDNNIKLLRISYKELNNISNILDNFFYSLFLFL